MYFWWNISNICLIKMALFPAYADASSTKESENPTVETEPGTWLENSSFKIDVNVLQPSSSSTSTKKGLLETNHEGKHGFSDSDSDARPRKHAKHKKKHKKKSQREVKKAPVEEEQLWNDFKIDTTRNREFLTVERISRPSAPRCQINFRIYGPRSSQGFRKKKKIKRYFHVAAKKDDQDETETPLTKKDLEKEIVIDRNEHFTGFKQEQDMSEATAVYNRSLGENPRDIDLWLKYVRYQDAVFQFEKSYRKGSMVKGLRVTAERKLAILDKALTHNPDCEALMRERLNVAVCVYPSDELQTQLKKLVEKDPGNIIWWQGYIEATQCSMSHCNTPAVLSLYTKCLSTLHQLRRNSTMEKAHLEENILRMLYQCGLFLKQSGLFEQLWTLLRLYLELNLSPSDKNKFYISSGFNDKQLVELEEVVLLSQLPIHELWLRVERLREACHWLPFSGTENCEDPQRLVFSEDVAELIHPITMPGNTFKLTATILTLLKTPLLPCRHTTMQGLGLDYVPWALDSVETLLPMFLPLYPLNMSNKNFLKDTQRLAVGPQFLKTFPGQEEYLEFLLNIIRNCMDCLHGKERTAVAVWWFRFQRLLIVLDKENRFKMSSSFKKKIKSSIKQLLKTDEHRNNVIFYQEYALVEYELGNFDSAVNIIITAISMHADGKCVLTITDEEERSTICLLYRTLIELNLNAQTDIETNKQKALKYLISLTLGRPVKTVTDFLTQGSISEASLKFKHVTLQLLQNDIATLMAEDHFLPNFFTDWIICNGWFLYLTKSPIECGTFLEDTLSLMEASTWQKEILFEFYTAMLFKHCLENPGVGMFKLLDDALYRAIALFPNNLFLLAVLAKEQSLNCSLGQPWWKLSSLLMKTGHAIPTLLIILIANQRTCEIEENWIDTITGKVLSEDSSLTNRMMSIFRRLTGSEVCTRRCGLVWRLYLQFLHAHFDPSLCRKAYYRAVEECPWLKALYIDAAIYIPAELAQIQDLLIEKQLRLHVTPEELDILRS